MALDKTDSAAEELDLEQRELCADGSCIGLIGKDGRCSECGRTRAQAEAGVEAEEPGGDTATVELWTAEEPASAPFDETRELCPDGSCIGVIGLDGRCKECGLPRS